MPGITFENASPMASAGSRNDEAGQRSGDPDIEQHALGIDGGADADEGAEGADERRRGQEIRQAGVHAVVHAGEVVAEFVRQQDGQQRERERQAPAAATRVASTAAQTRSRSCSMSKGRLRREVLTACPRRPRWWSRSVSTNSRRGASSGRGVRGQKLSALAPVPSAGEGRLGAAENPVGTQ